MKKYFILIFTLLLLSCSSDSDSNLAANEAANQDGKGGSLATFILKNNYLYTVDQSNLKVFSIMDPTNPVKVNDVNVGFSIETLFSMNNYLFIGSRNGMFIYSIEQNPEVPVYVSQAQHFTACDPVVANSTHAFVTIHSNTECNGGSINELMIYDIADVQNPILVSSRSLEEPKGIALYNNYLLLCDQNDILVFDVSNPQNISLVKTIANVPAIDIIIDGNNMLTFTKTSVFQFEIDPTNIQNITQISSYGLN